MENPKSEQFHWPHLDGAPQNNSHRYEFRIQAIMEAAGVHTVRRTRDPNCPRLMHLLAPGGEVEALDLGDGWTITTSIDLGTLDPGVMLAGMSPERQEVLFLHHERAYRGFWERLKIITDARPELGPRPVRQPSPGFYADPAECPGPGGHAVLNQTLDEDTLMAALEPLGHRNNPWRQTTDPVGYRAWRIDLPHGSVRLWDTGNCWMNLTEVDLPPGDARAFAESLQRLLDRPELVEQRELIPVCTTGAR